MFRALKSTVQFKFNYHLWGEISISGTPLGGLWKSEEDNFFLTCAFVEKINTEECPEHMAAFEIMWQYEEVEA